MAQTPESTRLRDALAGALADAIRDASLPEHAQFAAIVAGVSGFEGRVHGRAPDLPSPVVHLLHDTPVAHAGALAGEPGVVVIAGTGSVAYALAPGGASALVGGWGYLFGDEGSAFALARDVLAHAMRASDEGGPSALRDLALRHFQARDLRALARSFYTGAISRAEIAAFAPAVIAQAERGDAGAAQFVQDAARALARLAALAAGRAGLRAPSVAFTGGMMRSAAVRESAEQWLNASFPQARCVAPVYGPAEGALLLAYKAAGIGTPTLRG